MQLFIIGIIISIIYSYFFLPKEKNEFPTINPTIYPILYKGMIIIPINKKKCIHIHHWILSLLLCLSYIFFDIPLIVVGISFGLIIQGLMYEDRFDIICKNPY
jgi:hypothetical protein